MRSGRFTACWLLLLLLTACPPKRDEKLGRPAQVTAAAQGKGALTAPARLTIDCRAPSRKISPLVYGFNYNAFTDRQNAQWELGGTARRWGGNTMSRYNWKLGNAWNTGRDWYYENVPVDPYTVFLDGNRAHGVRAALTLPMIGWVAKDTTSYSFPVSVFGAQRYTDRNHRPDAGNGVDAQGKLIPPGSPARTSLAVGPEFVASWISAIRARDRAANERSVDIYVLDNEPGLWNHTHRDVHPEPLSYDELLQRSLAYGAAIRAADPEGKIAGPAASGWPDIQYSARDTQIGWLLRPDRRLHGDVPLLPWYLRRMREEEERTKTHILDYVDVHWYPQSDGIYGDTKTDPASAALRIRSTRSLWDKTYTDESYIGEPVYLLPRLQAWIDQNFPGLGIMIGEWNFGGEKHMSGGLATAEALGTFTRHRVAAAFYWTVPPARSPALYAFRAYRDFDGKGGKFLDYSLSTQSTEGASLYASRDLEGTRIVAVALNVSPDTALTAQIDLTACGGVDSRRTFVYTGDPRGFVEEPSVRGEASRLNQLLPPYSISVFDLKLARPIATQVSP